MIPLLLSFISGISTLLGSVFIFIKIRRVEEFNTFFLSLSMTIMVLISIFDLLLRYNIIHSGEILIDNINIDNYSNENISNIIGFIMEYPNFFNISIKDNLEIFDSNFENILAICKYLEIDKIIEKLDNGYETVIDSNIDNNLKYMLSLARIFLKKSKIILINNVKHY